MNRFRGNHRVVIYPFGEGKSIEERNAAYKKCSKILELVRKGLSEEKELVGAFNLTFDYLKECPYCGSKIIETHGCAPNCSNKCKESS